MHYFSSAGPSAARAGAFRPGCCASLRSKFWSPSAAFFQETNKFRRLRPKSQATLQKHSISWVTVDSENYTVTLGGHVRGSSLVGTVGPVSFCQQRVRRQAWPWAGPGALSVQALFFRVADSERGSRLVTVAPACALGDDSECDRSRRAMMSDDAHPSRWHECQRNSRSHERFKVRGPALSVANATDPERRARRARATAAAAAAAQ
jgi:hypothetical protein